MTPLLKRLLSKQDSFITGRELSAAAMLQHTCDDFTAQTARFDRETIQAAISAAETAYLAEPTTANLLLVKEALWQEFSTGRTAHRLLELVKGAETHFLGTKVLEWVRPIWERGLEIARANVSKVTSEESARILAATGEAMTHSDVVVAAQGAVTKLEEIGRQCRFIERERAGMAMEGSQPDRHALRTPSEWLAVFGYGLKGKLPA